MRIKEIDQRRAIALEQMLEGRIVPRFGFQHELDVGPGHNSHIISNTRTTIKLRGGAGMNEPGSIMELAMPRLPSLHAG